MAGGKRHALGQHYLVDTAAIGKIVEVAEPVADSILWEVGVGDGALTEPLWQKHPSQYRLFELDPLLIEKARQRWPEIVLVSGDAVTTISRQDQAPDLVVGNLPYSAATAIWRRFCAPMFANSRLVFMFQKEVADRLLGADRASRGPMAVIAALLYNLDVVCMLSPHSFAPPPKVDSTVLRFQPKTGEEPDQVRQVAEELFAFLTGGFHARRKTLDNNLRRLGLRAGEANIEGGRRPETLTAQEWWRLFELYLKR